MTIADLGAIGEFVGAFAVVVTLGYLTVQVRQSNQASRQAAVQAFFNSIAIVNNEQIHDASLRACLRKGFGAWDGLTQDEQHVMHSFWSTYASRLHMGYRLWIEGTLDDLSYLGWEEFFVACLRTNGVSQWWAMQPYPEDFKARLQLAYATSEVPGVTKTLPFLAPNP